MIAISKSYPGQSLQKEISFPRSILHQKNTFFCYKYPNIYSHYNMQILLVKLVKENVMNKQKNKANSNEQMNNESNLPFVFTFGHLKIYLLLDHKGFWGKYGTILLIVLAILLGAIEYSRHFSGLNSIRYVDRTLYFDYSSIKLGMFFLFIALGYVTNLLCAFCIRKYILKRLMAKIGHQTNNHLKKSEIKRTLKDIITNSIIYIFSPDLFYSNDNKKKIKLFVHSKYEELQQRDTYEDLYGMTPVLLNHVRICNKKLIQQTNQWNVNLSIMIILSCLSFYLIMSMGSFDWLKAYSINNFSIPILLFQWLLSFLIVRLISRGFEVIVAFYKDVAKTEEKLLFQKGHAQENENAPHTILIQDYKKSLLLPKARISLAVHSLAEFNFLFATVYYVYYIVMDMSHYSYYFNGNGNAFYDLYSSIPFLETLIYSSSLGVFNISYSYTYNVLLNGMHFLQIVISCVLILIALAQYLGLNQTISKEEMLLYKHIQQYYLYLKYGTLFKEKLIKTNVEETNIISYYDGIRKMISLRTDENCTNELNSTIKDTDCLY